MKKPLIAAIACGALAAAGAGWYMIALEARYRNAAQQVPVLVARQYISQGSMIDAAQVEVRQVPKEYLQPKAVQSVQELIDQQRGSRLFMATAPLEAGEQVVMTKLVSVSAAAGIASVVPAGRRAVTMVFERLMVEGVVQPGNRVDMLGIFSYDDQNHRPQDAAVTVLQNILVLGVGTSVFGEPAPAAGTEGTTPALDDGTVPVTLAVTAEEAAILALTAERGSVRFTVRPLGDDTVRPVAAQRIKDVINDSAAVRPAGAADAPAGATRAAQKEVLDLINRYRK